MTASQKKALSILRKYRDVSESDVAGMSAWEIWQEVEMERREERKMTQVASVCMTGFKAPERAQLEAAARRNNMDVRKSVTNHLTLLVCGPNAGPTKIHDAEAQGTIIVSAQEFEKFLATGEVP
jgi:NAD-dependent DNA ligase